MVQFMRSEMLVRECRQDMLGPRQNFYDRSEEPVDLRKKENMEQKLYVGNLSYATTEDELRTLFSQAGTVVSVDLIKDRATGNSKGFAFVQMSSQAEAESAISMFNGHDYGERQIRVSVARPREETGGRGGFERRSGGGGGFGRKPGGYSGDRGRGGQNWR